MSRAERLSPADGGPPQRPNEPRREARGENRLPPAIAVVVAGALYTLLPDTLRLGPRVLVPAVEAVLLIALLITNPRRMTRETRTSRGASLVLAAIVIGTNLVALALLVADLVTGRADQPFYWELDRGGPVARARRARTVLPPADWRFSQDENDDAVTEVAVSASGRSGGCRTTREANAGGRKATGNRERLVLAPPLVVPA